ncbi:glycosyltransferase [Alcaligenaceae bacterium]|nr:glycosyltransferase [Alcaligenaceae bacterium]
MKRTVFTLCTANELPSAGVLFQSLKKHEPDSDRVLILVERNWPTERREALEQALACKVLQPATMDIPEFTRLAFQYDACELKAAIKPHAVRALFRQGHESVLFLDPQSKIFGSLQAAWDALPPAGMLLMPFATEPLPFGDGILSSDTIARRGQFNFGCVGFSGGPRVKSFLEWWTQALDRHASYHPQAYFYGDQFHGQMACSFLDDAHVWRHTGFHGGSWNAATLKLERTTGDWTTRDGALSLFQFHSGDAAEQRVAPSANVDASMAIAPALAELFADYASDYSDCSTALAEFTGEYSYAHYEDGKAIDGMERLVFLSLHAAEQRQYANPFSPDTRKRLGTYTQVDDAAWSPSGLLWQLWQSRKQREELETQHRIATDVADANLQAEVERYRLLDDQYRERENDVKILRQDIRSLQADVKSVQKAYEDSRQYIDMLQGSTSYKLGRLLTSPLRFARESIVPAGRRGIAVLRHFREYGRVNGWGAALRAAVSIMGREGLKGVARRGHIPAASTADSTTRASRRKPTTLLPHTESVDIIVCVHNALDDVRNCLAAVLRNTAPPYQLILVDDGSKPETRDFVKEFADSQGVPLIRNEEAKGYTLAANQGLRTTSGDFVILLNSDTIVTPGWLERMLRCFRENPKVGAAGPLSNTASWQSVPRIFDDSGDWNDNPLPEGVSIDDMAAQVAMLSACQYPRVGFLNGFCYMIRRETMDEVGIFDEETFGRGFGEEDDFSLRARAAGWELAVVDDTYVFHAQSRSYSSERRLKLTKLAGEALSKKHGDPLILEGVHLTRQNPVLAAARARLMHCWALQDVRRTAMEQYEGKRVLLAMAGSDLHPANPSFALARTLTEMGVDARIALLKSDAISLDRLAPQLDVPVEFLENWPMLSQVLQYSDGVFLDAGAAAIVPRAMPELADHAAPIINLSTVSLPPHYDARLYTPINRKGSAPLNLLIMVDGTDASYVQLAIDAIKALRGSNSDDTAPRVIAGNAPAALINSCDQLGVPWADLEKISAEMLADAFDAAQLFLNLDSGPAARSASVQAMACGVAVVAPREANAGQAIIDNETGLLIDTVDSAVGIESLRRLIKDAALRQRLQESSLAVAPKYAPEHAAAQALSVLFASAP